MKQSERILKLAQEQIAVIRQSGLRGWGKSFTAGFKAAIDFTLENQWIPVKEGLPENRRNVLILLDDGDIRVGYHSDKWYWCDGFVSSKKPNGDCNYTSSVSIKCVTHWMPIPKLTTFERNGKDLKGGE